MTSWATALRERLNPRGDEAVTPESLGDPRAAARFLGFAFVAGALLALVSMALPQPPGTDVPGLFAVDGVALALGAFLLARGPRITTIEIAGVLFIATLLVSLGIHFTEQRTGVYSLFYVWIALEAVFFLSRRAAFLQIIPMAIALALVLADERPPGAEEQWAITVGTVLLVGVLVGLLKAHAERLIARLADAARTDPLTGLHNRRGFRGAAGGRARAGAGARASGEPARRRPRPLQAASTTGSATRPATPRCRRFADPARRLSRQHRHAARIGGEEFALHPSRDRPSTTPPRGRAAARGRVRTRSRTARCRSRSRFGVAALTRRTASTPDALLRAGDQALYAAKQLGRDRIVLYNAEVVADLLRGDASRPSRRPSQLAAVLVLAEALDLRDYGHRPALADRRPLRRAASPRELGLPPAVVERVRLAGVLHDVGKIGVPDADPAASPAR